MSNITVHVGLPRTGTTVLQKHILPRSKSSLIISKRPYRSSVEDKEIQPGFHKSHTSLASLEDILTAHAKTILKKCDNNTSILDIILRTSCFLAALDNSPNLNKPQSLNAAFCNYIKMLLKENNDSHILISSERFSMTSAGLEAKKIHRDKQDIVFPIYCLLNELNSISQPLVIVCFREPLGYLTSMYLWTFIHRIQNGMKRITPKQYIKNQHALELSRPGTSILATARHKEYTCELEKLATVKTFGFKELINSKDVFSLIGLENEDIFSFNDLPLENSSPFSIKEKDFVRKEITLQLKELNIYSKIKDSQLYE